MILARRVIKSGSSYYIALPPQFLETWGLTKGSVIRLEVKDNQVIITPPVDTPQPLPEGAVDKLRKAMEEVSMKITTENEGRDLHLRFGGKDDSVKPLVRNLWRWLPVTLAMLGVRTVEELPE